MSEAPIKIPKEVHVLSAKEWDRVRDKWIRATPAEQKLLRKKERYELSVEDIRDEVVGVVHNTYGRGETGYREVEARLGPHHRTLERWASAETKTPTIRKMREALRACGYDFAIRKV